ncbi:hypothetical protein [Klebsiella pneumoniae]|uniref:hypothetical protein n=1 Tax=Klebsiella pneumoniae TaxID=573 RepID=UPI001D0D7FD5|nr:hypothetical protein [Klebsiella pneumoniae]
MFRLECFISLLAGHRGGGKVLPLARLPESVGEVDRGFLAVETPRGDLIEQHGFITANLIAGAIEVEFQVVLVDRQFQLMLDVPADQLRLLFQGQGAFLQNGFPFRFVRRFDIQVEIQRLFPDNFAGFLAQLLADAVRQLVGCQGATL